MYGPPLEMFHCGGTVVTWDVTGSEEYVVDGVNGLVCEMGDFVGLRDALRRVVSDSHLLESSEAGAERTAAEWPDWKASSEEFAAYVFGSRPELRLIGGARSEYSPAHQRRLSSAEPNEPEASMIHPRGNQGAAGYYFIVRSFSVVSQWSSHSCA